MDQRSRYHKFGTLIHTVSYIPWKCSHSASPRPAPAPLWAAVALCLGWGAGLAPGREPECGCREAGQGDPSPQVGCQLHDVLSSPPGRSLSPTPGPPLVHCQSRHLVLEDAIFWKSPIHLTVGKGD